MALLVLSYSLATLFMISSIKQAAVHHKLKALASLQPLYIKGFMLPNQTVGK
jgi:hypothetical protein